jgi:chorismate dehydratase
MPAFSQVLKAMKHLPGKFEEPLARRVCYTEIASRPIALVNPVRISIVEYLNTAPLVRGFTHGPLRGKYELSFTVPSQCAEALRSGAVDVAIIPAIEYQRIPDLVILPNLSIASKKSVRSLLLVAKKPIQEVTRIALDRSSRSTQALTRILCEKLWRIKPEFFEAAPDLPAMLRQADGALLIGDPALRLAIACAPGSHRDAAGEIVSPATLAGLAGSGSLFIYDIVEKWRAMTSLPAVLAVWAARKEAVTPELVQDFQDSLAFGLEHVDAIASEAAAAMRLPVGDLRRYLLENIDYHLDEENLRGLTRYYELAAELGLIPEVRKVALAHESSRPARSLDFAVGSRRATQR